MSNFDHYAAANELIAHLTQDGYSVEAETLKRAMDEGATGTEIFMALRFQLGEIIKRIPSAGNSEKLALRLLAELTDSLQ